MFAYCAGASRLFVLSKVLIRNGLYTLFLSNKPPIKAVFLCLLFRCNSVLPAVILNLVLIDIITKNGQFSTKCSGMSAVYLLAIIALSLDY